MGTYPDANTCSGGAATNYTLVEVASTATVDPAPLTVTASPTVSDYGTAPTVTPIYSGFKNGDTASVVVTNAPLCTSSVLATTGVGTYPDANTCSGGAATNYTLVEVASTATVDPAPSTS